MLDILSRAVMLLFLSGVTVNKQPSAAAATQHKERTTPELRPSKLPGEVHVEALQVRRRVAEVGLDLLALVEDRAVRIRAEDVLVQRPLAPLALRPQFIKRPLVLDALVDALQVDLALARLAVPADRARTYFRLAAQAM